MEEQPSPVAASGDNFGSFEDSGSPPPQRVSSPLFSTPPVTNSLQPSRDLPSPPFKLPAFQNEAIFLANDIKEGTELQPPLPASPSSISRSASLSSLVPQKQSFMANFGQPWGLFQSEEDNVPSETVRHPLMGHHPLSDEDEEDTGPEVSPSKLPTESASSTTKTFPNSPEAVTSARPVLNPSPLSFSRLSMYQGTSEVSSLRRLARQGAWRALVDKVKTAKKMGSLTTPVEELNYATYHLLALMKLRSYGAAGDELAALGDIDALHYRYDEYPSVYPGKSGSMVPFALRWMHAELPHRIGQTATTMERLYALLAFCNARIEILQAVDSGDCNPSTSPATCIAMEKSFDKEDAVAVANQNRSSDEEDPSKEIHIEEVGTSGEEEDFGEFVASEVTLPEKNCLMWTKRKEAVIYALVGHHLYQKQFIVALQWLNQLLARSPTDADLLSKVGYVQLQLGDLPGAQQTFSQVDSLLLDSLDINLLNLAGRNKGLLHFAEKQYAKAFNEFNIVLGRNPLDTVSANNKALCLMYSRELVGATSVLEDSLQSSPRSTLNETMVLNLCSMYELASMNSVDSKRTLSTWLLNHAPDDFDLSCTRL